MDAYEATRIVFSRIQNLDPENASKIMGLLLIQDHGEKEMIRLAFGPEALVHSIILKARKDLNLFPSNSSHSTATTPSAPSPSPFLSNPISISRQNSNSSRLGISLQPPPSLSIPSLSSSPAATTTTTTNWSTALSELQNQEESMISPNNLSSLGSSSSSMNSSSLPFYGSKGAEMIDDFHLQDQLSFLNDGSPDVFYPQSDLSSSPTGNNDPLLYGAYGGGGPAGCWGGGSLHRRSCSVSDGCSFGGSGSDDPNCGFGWKPCLYYARGFCKNGTTCRFLHGGGLVDSPAGSDGGAVVGSPSGSLDMMDHCHELLRSKSAQQQRLATASQLMSNSLPYSSKCMNFLLQRQHSDTQRAAAALMMGEDMHKFGRSRLERHDFPMLSGGTAIASPASRQIYLTFPADSTFREEDVSNYFSNYGPVQDVRIPYQQKRMFGFVTFVFPETVKLILAKGNPHFVCDARVLVKPYKEKGKVPDKKQQMERGGDFSPCAGPDSRDPPFDLQLGARMFYNSQDLLWRRKMEESNELQQALELHSRRLMNLQLLDVKKHHNHNHHHRALSTGSPIPSPISSPNPFGQSVIFPPVHLGSSPESRENGAVSSDHQMQQQQTVNGAAGKDMTANGENSKDKESTHLVHDDTDLHESLDHNLPDSPFASPTKAATGKYLFTFSTPGEPNESAETSNNNSNKSNSLANSTTLDMASSFKPFDCQIPRFSSIGMYAGTDGPTCPVGI